MKAEVIFGPPGTGKTSEVINRIEALDSQDFLFCSFTRAAAKEGLKRIDRRGVDRRARTLHSLAYEHAGISKEQVVDSHKLKEFSRIVGIPMACAGMEEEHQLGDELLAFVGLSVCEEISIKELYSRLHPQISFSVVEMFSEAYATWKAKWGYVDFNDMLLRFIAKKKALRVGALFVDEAQDLSPLQWRVIKEGFDSDQVCIAGDDDQSIYAWSGAWPQGMTAFAKDTGCDPVILTQSYRVPQPIFELAQGITKKIKNRHLKDYAPTPNGGKVRMHGNTNSLHLEPGGNPALFLYRNHSVRWMLEDWLIQKGISYSSTGKRGLFDNFYVGNVRKFMKAQKNTSNREFATIIEQMKSKMYPALKRENNLDFFRRAPWKQVIKVPIDQLGYLERVNLFEEPKVRLSTIHGAKGAEADQVVLLTAMGTKTWEHMALNQDNEHRVWYVGVTRAKESLHLISGGLDYAI